MHVLSLSFYPVIKQKQVKSPAVGHTNGSVLCHHCLQLLHSPAALALGGQNSQTEPLIPLAVLFCGEVALHDKEVTGAMADRPGTIMAQLIKCSEQV